jgi:hypothetical protein
LALKCLTPDIDFYKKLKNIFIVEKINFFSHQIKEDMMDKIVLYQLPRYSLEELQEWLLDFNITPVDIKYINIKNQRYPSQTNYILYFHKKDKINADFLNKTVPILNHHVVKYKINNKQLSFGPTQCGNCQN